ncbi:bacteriohemerythrin [Novispirillum sp. DQ9]|uniref:bacteriohemerythrin n=1 Tax=Novispirillum sp. DQ9 TaxID=3398612 RepID=UPI003C7E66F2
MALLEWNDKMSVGVPALDEDHKKLLALVNELHSVVRKQAPPDVIERVMRDLVSYADYHFEAEERLMRLCRYADFEAHQASHETLRKQVDAMKERFAREGHAVRLKMFDFLSDWLMRHILGEDMKYKEALTARNRPKAASQG